MSKSKLSSRRLTQDDIRVGVNIVRLGDRIERFYICGIKSGWVLFSDGHSADISYMTEEGSRFRLDLEADDE